MLINLKEIVTFLDNNNFKYFDSYSIEEQKIIENYILNLEDVELIDRYITQRYIATNQIISANVINKVIDIYSNIKDKFKKAIFLYYFAISLENYSNFPMDLLSNAIISTENVEYIYYFAINIKNAPLDKLIDALIPIANADIFYNLAAIKKKSINKLANAVIKSRDYHWKAYFIYSFITEIENAPVDQLIDELTRIGNQKLLDKLNGQLENIYQRKLTNNIEQK